MTKLIVDQIQKTGGTEVTLPDGTPSNNQYLQTNGSGVLSYANGPVVPSYNDAIVAGSMPYLFCCNTWYKSGNFSSVGVSSELGDWASSNSTAALYRFQVATGWNPWGVTNEPRYTGYVIPPTLMYATGGRNNDIYVRSFQIYPDTSNRYNYPDAFLSVYFIKNTTSAAISSRTFYMEGSSYRGSSYSGQSGGYFTPNAANGSTVTSLTYTSGYTYTSNSSANNGSFSVTIPANTTIAILIYTSDWYWQESNGYWFQSAHGAYDIVQSFLTTGLEIDIDRTVRAVNNPTRSNNPVDIWN